MMATNLMEKDERQIDQDLLMVGIAVEGLLLQKIFVQNNEMMAISQFQNNEKMETLTV